MVDGVLQKDADQLIAAVTALCGNGFNSGDGLFADADGESLVAVISFQPFGSDDQFVVGHGDTCLYACVVGSAVILCLNLCE